jgi:hypothetical protein
VAPPFIFAGIKAPGGPLPFNYILKFYIAYQTVTARKAVYGSFLSFEQWLHSHQVSIITPCMNFNGITDLIIL